MASIPEYIALLHLNKGALDARNAKTDIYEKANDGLTKEDSIQEATYRAHFLMVI